MHCFWKVRLNHAEPHHAWLFPPHAFISTRTFRDILKVRGGSRNSSLESADPNVSNERALSEENSLEPSGIPVRLCESVIGPVIVIVKCDVPAFIVNICFV